MKSFKWLLCSALVALSCETTDVEIDTVKVGDTAVIGKPSANTYKHILIPKPNFILKKGGNPDIKPLKNSTVKITKVFTNGKDTLVRFEPTSNKKFFRAYTNLDARLFKAISTGELLLNTDL